MVSKLGFSKWIVTSLIVMGVCVLQGPRAMTDAESQVRGGNCYAMLQFVDGDCPSYCSEAPSSYTMGQGFGEGYLIPVSVGNNPPICGLSGSSLECPDDQTVGHCN